MISDEGKDRGDIQLRKVTDRLRRLCSKREYCSADILKKALVALDGDKKAAEGVLETLRKEKFVDDLRFAQAFVRDKSTLQGWGSVKIRYMLAAKGVGRDVIDQAIPCIEQEKAEQRLKRMLEQKFRTLEGDSQCRLKLMRFALGRGYSYDQVNVLIEEMLNNK